MDLLAVSMKAFTFLGVLCAATALNVPWVERSRFVRAALLGVAGVALMVANVWLSSFPLAVLVDLAYLGVACATLWRAWSRAPVAFEVVGEVDEGTSAAA